MVKVIPVDPASEFGAIVEGVNIALSVSEADFLQVRDALDRYAVVVLRDRIREGIIAGEAEQLAFARQFGPLDRSYMPKGATRTEPTRASASYGEVSNVTGEGKVWAEDGRRRRFLMANSMWHSNTSYKRISTWVTLLTAHEVPPQKGETEFSDMRRAWDDLPQSTKTRIDGLQALHSIFHSRGMVGYTDFTDEDRAAAPPVSQPIVRVHARTGRKSLYLSSHASHIVGWPKEVGRALLDELTEFATQPKYVFAHSWLPGEAVAWDNGSTMHRATPFEEFKYRRVLKRTSVNEMSALVD